MKLWAVGPGVIKAREDGRIGTHYVHDERVLHRVFIRKIGGIGEPNAGEFLVETPCGYKGWIRSLNKNHDQLPACEACLNNAPSVWIHSPIPEGATRPDEAS